MKKFLLLVLTLFLSTTVLLTGCDKKGLKDNPNTDDPVTSNGGMAVVKGDYLYYVNGFKTYQNLEKDKDNVWGKQLFGAIYRVKMNNNVIAHTDEGFLEKSEVVVPQIVGTENACFYIFGDYIYYATPNMQKDEYGNLLNARSNICRVNINGTGNKVLYTTDQTLTSTNWTMYELDDTVYVVMLDGSKVVSINANAKKPTTTVMTSSATSAGLIKTDKYIPADKIANKTLDGINNYVYYTRAITEDDNLGNLGGNILARVKLGDTKEEIVASNGNTYTITDAKNNSLYYTRTTSTNSAISVLCKYELSSEKTFVASKETEISRGSYSSTLILDQDTTQYIGNEIVTIDSSNNINLITVINKKQEIKTIYTGSATVSPIGLYGSTLFFTEDGAIMYIDVTAVTPEAKTVETDSKTIKTSDTFFDYDGRNVYFYSAYTPEGASDANYYLNRTDLQASDVKSEFVGVFAEGHTPEKPESDDTTTETEPWIK